MEAIRGPMRLALLAGLAIGACKGAGPGAEIPLPSVDEAAAFQREYERELREGETTALTAAFAHYVAEGDHLALGSDGREADAATAVLEFAQTGGRLSCVRGCGPSAVVIEHALVLPLGQLTLVASPQSGPGRVLVHDPNNPARASFEGVPWFAPDPAFIVGATIVAGLAASARLTTSRGLTKELPVFGELRFSLGGEDQRLTGYVSETTPGHTSVLIPFTDATTGDSTYPVGRYLTVDVPDGARAVALDFNRATNPLCAYSEHFNCPIPPAGNRLEIAVEAGERYVGH